MIYSDTVIQKTTSVFGNREVKQSLTALKDSELPIIREFARDDDIQEMTITSTNIGFVHTFQKSYEKETTINGQTA